MRAGFAALLLCLSFSPLGAEEEITLDLVEPRSLILAPPPRAETDSLLLATIEPTKRELRFDDVLAAERWEQNFHLLSRLPLDETFTLKQEFRAGMQNETILGDAVTTQFRDAITAMEKSSAEWAVTEALKLALAIQQQLLANNSVPFAEITTYGVQGTVSPTKTTTLKLEASWQDKQEFTGALSDQENYRIALEQQVQQLKASVAGGLSRADLASTVELESLIRKAELALRWNPLPATVLTLASELAWQELRATDELIETYALKLEQRLASFGKVELQAARELRASETAGLLTDRSAWSLGANSTLALHEAWNAGFGVRYKLQEAPDFVTPVDELSFTLSLRTSF